jgi:hypothetical protein
MAIAYVGYSTAGAGAAIGAPGGTQAGDLLVVNTGSDYGAAPSGWTQISTSGWKAGFWKFATGSDTFPGGASYTGEMMMAFRGVYQAGPDYADSQTLGGMSAPGYTPSIDSVTVGLNVSTGLVPGYSNWPSVPLATTGYVAAYALETAGVAQGSRGFSSANDGSTFYGTVGVIARFHALQAPGAPTVTFPNGGEKLNTNHTITWTAATDPDTAQGSLQYHIQVSTNNGGGWSDVVALTSAGATSYPYNFSVQPGTEQALVRIRAWDGQAYGPFDSSNAVFTINHQTNQMVM